MQKSPEHVRHLLSGLNYYDFFRQFHSVMNPRSYFEIGVNKGKSLALVKCASVGVDPKFVIDGHNVVGKKPFLYLAQQTSDVFFASHDLKRFFPDGLDVAFLDGMHLFEYLLRDFINTEKYAHGTSVIFLHDCLPINAEMSERVFKKAERLDLKYANHWTGDVWKVVSILQEYRPDLKVSIFDCPPTGLVMVERLDPKNTVLVEKYDSIVARFMDTVLDDDSLLIYRNNLELIASHDYFGSTKE